MRYKIPFIKPSFPTRQELITDYEQILRKNWYTNFGPFERSFSQAIGKYVGDGYYSATFSSATVGLMACIITALGRGDGTKYILMPSFTFAAGAHALIWCGFKPLFVDIENPSLQMSIVATERAIKQRNNQIAGILFCNSFGVGTKNISEWEKLSESTGKPLIIDSAAGFGSKYSPLRKVGSAGICEVFSFHATKPFSIGEGGAVVSKNKKFIKNLESVQNFGFDSSKTSIQLGFNAKLEEINAAIGIRQLKNFEKALEHRRNVYKKYKSSINPNLYYWQENAEQASLCFGSIVVKNPKKHRKAINALRKAGVETKTYYSPSLHKHLYFKNSEIFSGLEETNKIDASIISLPIHDTMPQTDIDLIISTLNNVE